MNNEINLFIELAALFSKHGYALYIVGGASRDFLLKQRIEEFDCATDATPKEMELFLPKANYVFAKYGTVTLRKQGYKFEITTFRTEQGYIKYRYPANIKFVKNIAEDYHRRDFTINALYINEKLQVYDFTNGQEDLLNKKLRMIGDPNERLAEDPLRIIRALRFSAKLDLTIDKALITAINLNKHLLEKLNPDKILFEKQKVAPEDVVKFNKLLLMFEI